MRKDQQLSDKMIIEEIERLLDAAPDSGISCISMASHLRRRKLLGRYDDIPLLVALDELEGQGKAYKTGESKETYPEAGGCIGSPLWAKVKK